MGRTFESVRLGAKDVSIRWLKAKRALKKEDQIYAQRLAEMATMHSSEAFYAIDDPLEAAVFSILIEMQKEIDLEKARLREREGREADKCGSSTPATTATTDLSSFGRREG